MRNFPAPMTILEALAILEAAVLECERRDVGPRACPLYHCPFKPKGQLANVCSKASRVDTRGMRSVGERY
jgi:hypothetical protein